MPLVSRSAFAKLAGVSAPSITKAIQKGNKPLAPAVVRKQINPDHPAAIAYIESKRKTDGSDNGKKPEPQKIEQPESDSAGQKEIADKPDEVKTTPLSEIPPEPKPQPKQKKAVYHKSSLSAKIQDMVLQVQSTDSENEQFEIIRALVHKTMLDYLPPDIRKISNMPLDEIITIFGTDADFNKWLESTKKIEDIYEKRIKNKKAIGELIDKDLVIKGLISPLDGVFNSLLTDGAKRIVKRLRSMYMQDKSDEDCEVEAQSVISKFIKPIKSKFKMESKRLDEKL